MADRNLTEDLPRFKAVCAYDGSAYNGWQKQKNGLGIQQVIEKALTRVHKSPSEVTAAGRTDAGVHALGQVFHFDGRPNMTARGYYNALNTLLPKDIRILSVERTAPDFHARFSSRRKRYDYIFTRQKDNPFIYRYKSVLRSEPDLEKMREAASVFLGKHDFTSFTHAKIDPEKPRVKNIESIEVLDEGEDIRLVFRGDGFMRYQVRMMTAVILAAGLGKLKTEDVRTMLEARDKHAVRFNADPQGLYLVEVGYEENSALSDHEDFRPDFWPEDRR